MGRAEEIFEKIFDQGEVAIDEFIQTRASEELFLDFKRSADHGRGTALHQADRSNLEKAVSGFGNSEGGVIVWGVDCSRDPNLGDVASAKIPIEQPARFKSWLEGVGSGLTVPAHGGLRHHAVTTATKKEGFVVSLVPMSDHAPHQTTNDKRYYMRAGSNFLPVPHAVLAGMFGRRPQPRVYNTYTLVPPKLNLPNFIQVEIGLMLYNEGRGIAEQVFLNATVISTCGPNCGVQFPVIDKDNWFGNFHLDRKLSLILHDGIRVPPSAFIQPTEIDLHFQPPFNSNLKILCNCGAAGSPTSPFTIEADQKSVELAFDAAITDMGSMPAVEIGRRFVDTVFKGLLTR